MSRLLTTVCAAAAKPQLEYRDLSRPGSCCPPRLRLVEDVHHGALPCVPDSKVQPEPRWIAPLIAACAACSVVIGWYMLRALLSGWVWVWTR